ncbi:MAG TPA: heavy metal-associated domain-containing protein [Thermoplasmataceae archaeon]|nr:heavy metal-associated domain-containing protein [Thermoplasmataceae archaeon]
MKRVELRVYGMTCNDCALKVKKSLENEGFNDVVVSLEGRTASFMVEEGRNPEDALKSPVFGAKSPYKAQIRSVS